MEYFANIRKDKEGYFLVTFPDFKNVNTYGETLNEALSHGKEALSGCIESDLERELKIPKPSNFEGKKDYYKIVL